MKHRFISDHRERTNVGLMCKVLNISRSGYYAWLKRPESHRSKENRKLADHIRIIHAKSRKIYGAPRIYRELKENGVSCSQNRVARIMKQEGIRGIAPRKFKATTDSKHNFPVAPNLLNRDFDVKEPHRVWLADITYIHTAEGWLYLSAIMDLGSRRIMGWAMSDTMKRKLTLDALTMAICNYSQTNGIIHHSDRGSQYASEDYQNKLQTHDFVCSMSRKGNCWDNAPMESFFHTLKTEWVYGFKYRTRREARANIFDYIEIFYNRQRRHSTLGYITPCQYEQYRLAA
jgi:putative transposase